MAPPNESRGFTPIPNPYITDNPVRGEKVFFGRQDIFESVQQRLEVKKRGCPPVRR
ncbi:MAG: hypothetical protein HY709_03350 [Candidatus Latescibacteria bacterium]|nr:hypothetical protein [Candidatus Latescibacterota bacterium]